MEHPDDQLFPLRAVVSITPKATKDGGTTYRVRINRGGAAACNGSAPSAR